MLGPRCGMQTEVVIIGLYWGRLGDKLGRRPVALVGMLGMTISCVVMGFSGGLLSCALIRAFAGLMSSSIRVSTATMIGDVSETSSDKARNFSRLPLVATGGVIGPLLQALLAHRFLSDSPVWKTFPILSSQLACASLMFIVFLVNLVFLKEVFWPHSMSLCMGLQGSDPPEHRVRSLRRRGTAWKVICGFLHREGFLSRTGQRHAADAAS
jgi:MFS family permease